MRIPYEQQYKVDITGVLPENRIVGERVDVSPKKLCFMPKQAPFFYDNFNIYAEDGTQLVLNKDYRFIKMCGKLSAYAGKEIGIMVKIISKEVSTRGIMSYRYDYNTFGGPAIYTDVIVDMVNDLINDDRPVYWENIIDLPEYFPVEDHTHDIVISDYDKRMYDFEPLAVQIDHIAERVSVDTNMDSDYFNFECDKIRHYLDLYKTGLTDYITRHVKQFNSHGDTKEDYGVEYIDNVGTCWDIYENDSDGKRITPSALKQLIDKYNDEVIETMGGLPTVGMLVAKGNIPITKTNINNSDISIVTSTIKIAKQDYLINGNTYHISETSLDMGNVSGLVEGRNAVYVILNLKDGICTYSLTTTTDTLTLDLNNGVGSFPVVGLEVLLSGTTRTISTYVLDNCTRINGVRFDSTRNGNAIPCRNKNGKANWIIG